MPRHGGDVFYGSQGNQRRAGAGKAGKGKAKRDVRAAGKSWCPATEKVYNKVEGVGSGSVAVVCLRTCAACGG